MADSRSPGLQLFHELFPPEENIVPNAALEKLKAYLEAGGSIFPLVEKGVSGMVRDEQVSAEDAQRFLRRANSMATYLRRRFIEHKLSGNKDKLPGPSGLLSMVDGPSYQYLFDTSFSSMCPPDALESLASPAAYFIDLLRWIRDRIEPGIALSPYALHDRRKDLMPLEVDFNAVYQPVSSVDIIVDVLETFIESHSPEGEPVRSIEDKLIDARYPNGLPYYQHWVTIDVVAQLNGLSVGDFARTVDLSYPYFLQANAWDARPERALAHATRLGPYQRALLTEPAVELVELREFYRKNYGIEALALRDLNWIPTFADHTKLDSVAIERLLSIRDFAPLRSPNVKYPEETAPVKPESGRSGSVYINANAQDGGIDIISSGPTAFIHRLSLEPEQSQGLAGFDRINRMVRLCTWLELPSDQVDTMIAAAIRADVRGGANPDAWWITPNVVHALGLFQTLHERYDCSAADFAVLLDQLSIYGRGDALSQFDQVFNSQGNYRQPLRLDEGPFPVTPAPGVVDLTINQLCNGLGIDIQTYQYLALAVAKAHNITDNMFKRSLPIISSFYRLVRLPRLLNITPVEGVLMLTLLGDGDGWIDGVAGEPVINPEAQITPDILHLIDSMRACVQWCEECDLPVLWMLQHVAQPGPVREASDQDLQLFDQIRNLLAIAKFSNAGVLMAGLPPAGAASWLDFLTTDVDVDGQTLRRVVDVDGLVLAPVGTPEQYLIGTRKRLEWAVDSALGKLESSLRTRLVETLLKLLLDTRDAQESLVKETLAVYAGIAVAQAIPVLNWANATVYQLLQQVNARRELNAEPGVRRNEIPDALLGLLADVRRRSDVVTRLGLSAVLLQEYLDYGHAAWLVEPDKYAFSIRTLYYLTTLTRAFALSAQPEQKLLDYLRQVNALPDSLSEHAKRLAQQASAIKLAEFFGWSVQEVNECVSRIDPQLQILKSLPQLALLLRVRELSTDTGMDALTIFLIGNLPVDVDRDAYAEAAELALLSETATRVAPVQLPGDLAQLVTTTCTVEPTEIVRSAGSTAKFTVTLKDAAGAPLSGVMVHFRASLGSIESGFTGTDGTFEATYTVGTELGTDTPVYWLDLFEPENAPSLNLIPDHESLDFVLLLRSPVPSGEVASGQEVELYATLMDRFGNLGKDELVFWALESGGEDGAEVTIRPRQGRTNQEGLTRVFVSSASGGTFRFRVHSDKSGKAAIFDPIVFNGDPAPE